MPQIFDSVAFAAAVLLAAAGLAGHASRLHNHIVEHIDRQVNHLGRLTMSATQDAVNAVVDQLRKAQAEIVAKIADVQEQVDSAGADVDLSALTEAAQALDDIVPDAPVVESAPADPASEV